MNQQQKCVVITGGSRGLGLAIIHRLFEAGYAVATCSRHRTNSTNPTPASAIRTNRNHQVCQKYGAMLNRTTAASRLHTPSEFDPMTRNT